MSSVGSSTAVAEPPNSISNAALRLALSTLKDRCQHLQNRLSMLEEENLQLRIERHYVPVTGGKGKEPVVSLEAAPLLRKVDELARHKSKLSHHIYTVATENKHLWETLSKLAEDRVLDILSPVSLPKPKKSLRTILNYPDENQLSLNEGPVESQDVFQMKNSPHQLDRWNSTASIKECEYPTIHIDDDEDEIDGLVCSEISELLQSLEEDKKLLKQQQLDLKSAIDAISKFSRGVHNTLPHAIPSRETLDSQSTMEEYENLRSICSDVDETNRSEGEVLKISNGVTLRNKENNFEDRICPLCTKFYAKSTPFDEFNDHVLSHFVEDSEQDSHLSFQKIAT